MIPKLLSMILAWQSLHASQKPEQGGFVDTDCVLRFKSNSCSCAGQEEHHKLWPANKSHRLWQSLSNLARSVPIYRCWGLRLLKALPCVIHLCQI